MSNIARLCATTSIFVLLLAAQASAQTIGGGLQPEYVIVTADRARTADPAAAVPAAVDLLAHAAAVSASGPVDHAVARVAGRTVLVKIAGGSGLLPRVTATGCSLGALVAAYAAVAPDPFTGVVAAHVHFAVAAELAEAKAKRPGSFAVAFVDSLDAVDEAVLRERARIAAVDVE